MSWRGKSIWLAFAVCLAGQLVQAQTFLSLESTRQLRRIRYYPGDELVLRLKGEKRFYTTTLDGMRRDSLFLTAQDDGQYLAFPMEQVVAVRTTGSHTPYRFPRTVATLLQAASIFFLLAEGFNGQFEFHRSPVYRQQDLILYSSLFVAGTAAKVVMPKTFSLGHRWQLRSLNLEPVRPGER